MGIAKIVISVVAGMEGVQALMGLVEDILKDGLEPLNKAFKAIKKTLDPIIKVVTSVVTVIAEATTQIVGSLLDNIQPILEAVQPILQTIFDVLSPILDMITGIIDVILAPFMGILNQIIVPILRHVGNCLSITLGIVEVGFGAALKMLAFILKGIGILINGVTPFSKKGNGMINLAGTLKTMGDTMFDQGINSVKSGIEDEINMFKEIMNGEEVSAGGKKEETKTPNTYTPVESTGSVMDGMAAGSQAAEAYGSGDMLMNQKNYSGSMHDRGCGPIALADAYRRRTGRAIDPGSLVGNGDFFDPNRGTSVRSMMRASNALGMNTTVGGVNAGSLRRASSSNPVTVLGSGTAFGTRAGNNHYVNVIGTDSHGGAYVMNPLTGGVSRQTTSDVVSGAKLGMYGGGDYDINDLDSFNLSDTVKDAFSGLSGIAAKILSIFTGDDESTTIEKKVNKASEKSKAEQLKTQIGTDAYDKYDEQARALFKTAYPKRANESDADYEKRYLAVRESLINKLASKNRAEENKSKREDTNTKLNKSHDTFNDGETEQEAAINSDEVNADGVSNAGKAATGVSSTIKSSSEPWQYIHSGALLGNKSFRSDVVDVALNTGTSSGDSPLHRFFSSIWDEDAWTKGGWWKQYGAPQNEFGVGSTGDTHTGMDINSDKDGDGEHKLLPTTSGKITDIRNGYGRGYIGSKDGNGYGNSVAWLDADGNLHRYAHMKSIDDKIKVGDTISGGETFLGYLGSSGNSSNDHLHYEIAIQNDPNITADKIKPGDNNYMVADSKGYGKRIFANPATYFTVVNSNNSNDDGTGGSADFFNYANMTPNSDASEVERVRENVYKYLRSIGMSGIGAAGLMGCFNEESAFHPNNLENSFEKKWGTTDSQFTNDVDSGRISRDEFLSPAKGRWGYGLPQFTSIDLKRGLYDATVPQGKSISDVPAQLDSIVGVLKQRSYGDGKLYDAINNAEDPTTANKYFLWRYEAGTGYKSDAAVAKAYPWMGMSGINKRHQNAEDYYSKYSSMYGGGDLRGDISIPPVDSSIFDQFGSGDIGIPSRNVINTYNIRRDNTSDEEKLRAILSNVYKVSAEKVEALLTEILEEMRASKKAEKKTTTTAKSAESLFTSNAIPANVGRLYS